MNRGKQEAVIHQAGWIPPIPGELGCCHSPSQAETAHKETINLKSLGKQLIIFKETNETQIRFEMYQKPLFSLQTNVGEVII